MKPTKTLLAAAVLSMIAFAGHLIAQAPAASPTPNPNAGTWRDTSLTVSQRVRLAHEEFEKREEREAVSALQFILLARPALRVVEAYPTIADDALKDPSFGGRFEDERSRDVIAGAAAILKAETIPSYLDRVTFLAGVLKGKLATRNNEVALKSTLIQHATRVATAYNGDGNYAATIDLLEPIVGYGGGAPNVLTQLLAAKRASRADDLLSWAKLFYQLAPFQHTQTGIEAVSSAFRALDGNLARANAFIAFQKDGVGEDPLASVPLPKVEFAGTAVQARIANKLAAGERIAALKIAVEEFSTARNGPPLNAATSLVAQCLRNIDGHLVRANLFVESQSKGEPFTIDELQ